MPADESTVKMLQDLEVGDAKHQGEIAPSVHAYGAIRPMGRIRSYSSAGLAPFAGRGAQSEFHLLGHVHLTPEGQVSRVEGFNGQEGERWAKAAADRLRAALALAPGAVVQPLTPLRACAATGIR
jgi:hypothetical protein